MAEMQLSYSRLLKLVSDLEAYAESNHLDRRDTYIRAVTGINDSFIVCDRDWDEAERLGEPHPRV